jgi:tRNA(Ile2)-agmatinylcytidine synthase
MGWIGLDDTDTVEGGCTTWDFHQLLSHIENAGYQIQKAPRLVRLWPFAPDRTRGNAALSAEIVVNQENENDFIALLENWFEEKFRSTIHQNQTEKSAHPSLVWSPVQFPEDWYWDGVRKYVNPEERHKQLNAIEGVHYWFSGSHRGIVGATSSIAWRGEEDWTWEATAWREKSAIGQSRIVSTSCVFEMSEKFPATILNRDPNAGKSLISPRTPCPVLYGIRAEDEIVAKEAHDWLQSNEGIERAVAMRVHRSNQATGDHINEVKHGVVISRLEEVKGGHASISVFSEGKRYSLVAFKQGGEVNSLLRSTEVGDIVEWRGLQSIEGEVHLESLVVIDAVPRYLERPHCHCGQRFQRQGIEQPLRCSSCGGLTDSIWHGIHFDNENVWREPHPAHRRHLAKPLSREAKG